MDAEPRAPSGQAAPLATPNAGFNKLATVLAHLAAALRSMEQEVRRRQGFRAFNLSWAHGLGFKAYT